MSESAAILVSRQAMRPSGRSSWVRKTVEAVRWVASSGGILVTSHGMPTWELQLSLASDMNVPVIVYVLAETDEQLHDQSTRLATQFCLKNDRTELRRVIPKTGQTEDIRPARDRAVVDTADLLIPVALREGGNLQNLLAAARLNGKELEASFQTASSQRDHPLSYSLDDSRLNSDLTNLGDYVIHWTRTANTAWPGEKLIDYYRAIVSSDSYPRTAYETLRNILNQKSIKASSRHMPRNIATVSFSSLTPQAAIPLMKWRARYRQMSFEPYGVGIDSRHASACGIQPVKYTEKRAHPPDDTDVWLTQSIGVITDWRLEKEYRHLGDFDFSGVPADSTVVFTLRREEAVAIRRDFALTAISFLP